MEGGNSMIESIKFDNYDSYLDLGLYLESYDDDVPEQVRSSIDIPGKNGVLDTTYFLDKEPKFKNRKIRFIFVSKRKDYDNHISEIMDKIHAREMIIKPFYREGFHLTGNVSVSKSSDKGLRGQTVTVACDCYPFYLRNEKTVVERTVNGNMDLTLSNGRSWQVPMITSSSTMIMTFEGRQYSINASDGAYYDIVLKSGANKISIRGTGNIKFEYQEEYL